VGGAGADVLVGGNGRSVLIGGGGNDVITGGSGDDILIGGTTNFDARDAALQSILLEWQRTDRAYLERVADLSNGGGLNRGNKLIFGKTVHDDGGSDVSPAAWAWIGSSRARTVESPTRKTESGSINASGEIGNSGR
jgi:Ca2+-binding RTX toxin-like protein